MDENDDAELFARARAVNCVPSAELLAEKAQQRAFFETNAPPELKALFDGVQEVEQSENGDMGLSLLAAELARSGELFLWWD